MTGQSLDYSSETKYLGVILDSELKWKRHIDKKVTNAKKILAMTLNITRANHGPKPSLMKWTYTGIVRPAISYAALNWAHETRAPGTLAKFKKLDRLAMLAIAQTKNSTPTEGLRLIHDVIPFHLFLQKVGLMSFARQFYFLEPLWGAPTVTKLFVQATSFSGISLHRKRVLMCTTSKIQR